MVKTVMVASLKKVFDVEKTIDTGVDDIYEELAKDFQSTGDQT